MICITNKAVIMMVSLITLTIRIFNTAEYDGWAIVIVKWFTAVTIESVTF